jgi:hypothetical protein
MLDIAHDVVYQIRYELFLLPPASGHELFYKLSIGKLVT